MRPGRRLGRVGLDGHGQVLELPGSEHRHRRDSIDRRLTEQVSEWQMNTVCHLDHPIVIEVRVSHLGDNIPFTKRAVSRKWACLLDHDTMNCFIDAKEGTQGGML